MLFATALSTVAVRWALKLDAEPAEKCLRTLSIFCLFSCAVYAVSVDIHNHNAAFYITLRHCYSVYWKNEMCRIFQNFDFPTIRQIQASQPDVICYVHQIKKIIDCSRVGNRPINRSNTRTLFTSSANSSQSTSIPLYGREFSPIIEY